MGDRDERIRRQIEHIRRQTEQTRAATAEVRSCHAEMSEHNARRESAPLELWDRIEAVALRVGNAELLAAVRRQPHRRQ